MRRGAGLERKQRAGSGAWREGGGGAKDPGYWALTGKVGLQARGGACGGAGSRQRHAPRRRLGSEKAQASRGGRGLGRVAGRKRHEAWARAG